MQAGQNAAIVADLDGGGRPTLIVFGNRSEIPAGQARVSVRHTAAAPAVDILAGASPVIEGLENPNAESLEVDAGSVEVGVAPAGERDPVIGPQTLDLAGRSPRQHRRLHA